MSKSSTSKKEVAAITPRVLHVGCGPKSILRLPKYFKDWQEIRLDIDARAEPDVVASITDMNAVQSESVEALFSSHNIEHLYVHEVEVAIREFYRVLAPSGFVFLRCPDLQSVAELIAQDKLFDKAYDSDSGPITPFDILYGHRASVAKNPFMAHKSGFTLKALLGAFEFCGFKTPMGIRNPSTFELLIFAYKQAVEPATAKAQFQSFLAA